MPVTNTLTHVCVESDFYTPTRGIALVSGQTNLPGASSIAVEKAGIFASASLSAIRQRRDVDLLDLCNTALTKVPKPWSKVIVCETIFNFFDIFFLRGIYCVVGC